MLAYVILGNLVKAVTSLSLHALMLIALTLRDSVKNSLLLVLVVL